MPTYKDIDLLTQKSAVAGTEKLPVSDTEFITPGQIIGGVNSVNAVLYNYEIGKALTSAGYTFDDADYCTTGYIDISSFTTFKFSVASSPASSNVRVCEYNAQKERVDAWGYTRNNQDLTKMATTKYVRLSYLKTETNARIFGDSTNLVWGNSSFSVKDRVDNIEDSIGDIATILASI